MNIIGVIPARENSSRLRKKLLIKVKNKTLIERVYNNARRAKTLKKLYVATDSKRIKEVIEKAGGEAVMTSKQCGSGTERIKESLRNFRVNINDIIVNIQGDEPMLEPSLIDRAVNALYRDRLLDAATIATPIKSKKELEDPACVKVVTGLNGEALYFSRGKIPFPTAGKIINSGTLRHIGLYAYRKPVLDRWNRLKSRYEKIEKLEQLRIIENGCRMKVITGRSKSIGIDTPADLRAFRRKVK